MSPAAFTPASQLLWTAEQTCREMNISPKSLYNITEPRGDLACVRLGATGRILRYDPEVIRAYIKRRQASAANSAPLAD